MSDAGAGDGDGAGRRLRLAVSGSAGTGKSTLAQRLAHRHNVPYVPEGMRLRLEAGLDLHTLDHHRFRALLEELFDETLAAVDAALESHGGFVSDRCPLDSLAFWLLYGFDHDEDATSRFEARALAAMGRFDRLVVLPWGAIPLVADGVRSTNRFRQLHFQVLLEGLVRRRAAPARVLWLPEALDGLEARAAWVAGHLDRAPPGRSGAVPAQQQAG